MDKIVKYVHSACLSPDNRFGSAYWTDNILVTMQYAAQLSSLVGANSEICVSAACLHNIAVVEDFSLEPYHAEHSAQRAQDLLLHWGHAESFAKDVYLVILEHREVRTNGSLELIALSNARALAFVAKPLYWLWYAFSVMGLDYLGGQEWYRGELGLLENRFLPEARSIAAEHIDFARKLLAR